MTLRATVSTLERSWQDASAIRRSTGTAKLTASNWDIYIEGDPPAAVNDARAVVYEKGEINFA
jgi:hypothetical protein